MQLREIYVHPLKSGRGNLQQSAAVDAFGLMDDRRWMLVTAEGRFITGRQQPKLVTVQALPDAQGIRFSAAGMEDLRVELDDLQEFMEVELWGDRLAARCGSAEADFWFADLLGSDCRLAQVGQDSARRSKLEPQAPLAFVDGFPLLLLGQASLDDLNGRLAQPVTMRHFRPNLVIDSSEPYIEDRIRRLRIGEVEFVNVKPCTRCIFTTVDPQLGVASADRQPMATLLRYRRFDIGTCFGVNLVALGNGVLQVGDAVEILEMQAA